ncbi:MAG: LamG domain-containing protein [Minisyncoccales bacterium]
MINLFNDPRKQSAFTLVELLVVVAVLALLASIVFSNLTGAREQAKISNALSFQSNTHNLLGADLVGWWNFDDDTGNIAKDSSGYGNNGTIVGATRVDGVPGTSGKAMDVSKGNHYIRLGPSNSILSDNVWTLSGWFNASQIDDSVYPNRIITFHKATGSPSANTGASLLVGDLSQAKLMYAKSGGSQAYLIHTDIETDRWYHFVGSYDGETYRSYINGGDMKSVKSTFDGFGAAEAMIGTYSTGSYFFNGLIDDVRIYSRALTAYEVQTLYAQTKDNYLAEEQ